MNLNENFDKYKQLLLSTHKPGMEDLITYIDSKDMLKCPASSRFHGNYEGGLVIHCLSVLDCLKAKNTQFDLGIPEETMVRTSLLHDICKLQTYVMEIKNKKVYTPKGSKWDSNGNYDWQSVPELTSKDCAPMGHGAKSVILIQQFIKLSFAEQMMIYWHMGPWTNDGLSHYSALSNLKDAELLKWIDAIFIADMEASKFLERTV